MLIELTEFFYQKNSNAFKHIKQYLIKYLYLESGLPRKNKYRPFVPNPEQMKLAPSVSGNTINGLDEEKVTKPKVVYWATEPNEIPHGEMQKWFYTVDPCLPDFAQERQKRLEIQNMPLPPISAKASIYKSSLL